MYLLLVLTSSVLHLGGGRCKTCGQAPTYTPFHVFCPCNCKYHWIEAVGHTWLVEKARFHFSGAVSESHKFMFFPFERRLKYYCKTFKQWQFVCITAQYEPSYSTSVQPSRSERTSKAHVRNGSTSSSLNISCNATLNGFQCCISASWSCDLCLQRSHNSFSWSAVSCLTWSLDLPQPLSSAHVLVVWTQRSLGNDGVVVTKCCVERWHRVYWNIFTDM